MRASFFVLLLLALVNPSVSLSDSIDLTPPTSSGVRLTPPRPLGKEESASPSIRYLANTTINWHNNHTDAHIVLSNVTGGNVRQQFDSKDLVIRRQYVLYIDGLEPKPNCKYSFAMKHYVGEVDVFEPPYGDFLVVNYFGEKIPE